MANYLNIFAGVLTLIGATAIAYGLWDPVMDFIEILPLELYVIAGSAWIFVIGWAIIYMPIIMMVSDDKGN